MRFSNSQPLVFAALVVGLLARTEAQDSTSTSEFAAKIKAIPGVVDVRPARGAGSETYEVMIEQPLDHANPDGEKFRQRFFISHVDYDKPVLLGTEGYAAPTPRGGELQRMLG